jgi:hypothetical protein
MCRQRTRTIGPVMLATVACATILTALPAAAQTAAADNVCSLATSEEFQRAYGINPQIGLLPDTAVFTPMTWGQHCDYADGSIDLFTSNAELERVLTLTKSIKQRVPVQGLGKRAFFTVTYPDDQYRRRGFLAIDTGSRLLSISMDDEEGEPVETTRPKLEALAKLVLPRLK